MASRSFQKALRSPLTRQVVSPAVQRRTIVSALGGVRATVAKASIAPVQQVRGVKTVDFAGHPEKVFGMLCSNVSRCAWHMELVTNEAFQNVRTGLVRSSW